MRTLIHREPIPGHYVNWLGSHRCRQVTLSALDRGQIHPQGLGVLPVGHIGQLFQRAVGDDAMQANTLVQLGTLYNKVWQRPEEAVAYYQRAAEIFAAIGHDAKEGTSRSNQALTLRRLHRLDEAREAISRAITYNAAFGHAALPWTDWALLCAIETEGGNIDAAAEARRYAIATFLAYRRDGDNSASTSGSLAMAVTQDLCASLPGATASLLQQVAADPEWAEGLAFVGALEAITAGSRDRSLAEDLALNYKEAAEVILMIEALEQAKNRG